MIWPFSRYVRKNRRSDRRWGWPPPYLKFPPLSCACYSGFCRKNPSLAVRYPPNYLSFEPLISAHFRSASFPTALNFIMQFSQANQGQAVGFYEDFMVFWAKRRLARLARLLSELVTLNQPQLSKIRRKLKKSGVTNTVSKSQR